MLRGLRLFKGKPASLLGVDICPASIKLVELTKQAHGWRVEAYGTEPLPPNTLVDGQFSDVERIGEAIRALKRHCGCRSSRAALALSGPQAVIKTFAVDAALADADVAATIEVEAARHLPGPPDEVAYDFEIQGLSTLDPKRADAVLAACPKAQLLQGLAVLRAGRLSPVVIEIQDLALARGLAAARTALGGHVEGLTALLDVGSSAAHLKVFENGLCIHRSSEAYDGADGVAIGAPEALVGEAVQATIDPDALARVVARALERFAASAVPARVGVALFAGVDAANAIYGQARANRGRGSALHGQGSAVNGQGSAENGQGSAIHCQGSATNSQGSPVHAPGSATSGQCSEVNDRGVALVEALNERLPVRAAVANPFLGMALAPTIDRQALFREAPSLLTACGLALRDGL